MQQPHTNAGRRRDATQQQQTGACNPHKRKRQCRRAYRNEKDARAPPPPPPPTTESTPAQCVNDGGESAGVVVVQAAVISPSSSSPPHPAIGRALAALLWDGVVGAEGGADVRGGPELRRRAALRDLRCRRQRAAAVHARRPRRPADQGPGPAVQPVRVADDAQLVREAGAALADRGRHRHRVEPAGHRHRPAQQRREGPDAGHVRLPQRRLALPLLRRRLPKLHRIPTGGERAPRVGALPLAEPVGGGHHIRGGLRGVADGSHPSAQRVGAAPLHVPRVAHAQGRRRLAAAQRHGPRQPPPARVHLQGRQGGRRGDRIRVALRRREPIRDPRHGERVVPQPRRVGRHERPVEVSGAGQLLQGPPQLPRGVQGQLGRAVGQGYRLPRQVRGPMAQLHRRRFLQEERPGRRRGGHGQGQRRARLRLREHLCLQRQRNVYSPARQDAQRHLQRHIRRHGVAAAAGASTMATSSSTSAACPCPCNF